MILWDVMKADPRTVCEEDSSLAESIARLVKYIESMPSDAWRESSLVDGKEWLEIRTQASRIIQLIDEKNAVN